MISIRFLSARQKFPSDVTFDGKLFMGYFTDNEILMMSREVVRLQGIVVAQFETENI